MCRGEPSTVITRLMPKVMWNGWKSQSRVKEIASPFPYCPVNRGFSWKKHRTQKKVYCQLLWLIALLFFVIIDKLYPTLICILFKACVRYFLSIFYFYFLNKNLITYFVWYLRKEKRYDTETLLVDRVLNKKYFYGKNMLKMCTKN